MSIMTENFPKLMSDNKLQIQGAHRIPRKIILKTQHLSISFSNYKKSNIMCKDNVQTILQRKFLSSFSLVMALLYLVQEPKLNSS